MVLLDLGRPEKKETLLTIILTLTITKQSGIKHLKNVLKLKPNEGRVSW